MTTMYRPVLIESAEQAEALPRRTVAASLARTAVAVRVGYGLGWSATDDEMSVPHDHVVGWAAFVPIEVEEEILHQDTFATSEQLRRYTTPWQLFTAPKEAP